MPLPPEQQELRVDPLRVIQHLKQRLLEEISKAALLDAALAESQEREAGLRAMLAAVQPGPDAIPAPAGLADGG